MNIKFCIAGKIASGKSTIAKAISEYYKYPIVSFGGILSHYCKNNNMSYDRSSLQRLGQKLIDEMGHAGFLNWILKNSNQIQWEEPLIVVGFRHVEIYKYFKKIFPYSFLIYCSCEEGIRIQRLMNRDKINQREANIIASHSTEKKINKLKSCADFVFNRFTNNKILFAQLNIFLQN